jgi:hypothetical protein
MTTQADYTTDEWILMVQAPALASLFIIQEDTYQRIPVARQLIAAIAAISMVAPRGPHTELIQAVAAAVQAGQVPPLPATPPDDLKAARRWVLDQCRHVAAVLVQKAPEAEAVAFTGWLIGIAQRVTLASDTPELRGARAAEAQMRSGLALEMLSAALTLPLSVDGSAPVRAA